MSIYFGPKAPAGKESNWIATEVGGRFFVVSRVYSPKKLVFDKTWQSPDIETAH